MTTPTATLRRTLTPMMRLLGLELLPLLVLLLGQDLLKLGLTRLARLDHLLPHRGSIALLHLAHLLHLLPLLHLEGLDGRGLLRGQLQLLGEPLRAVLGILFGIHRLSTSGRTLCQGRTHHTKQRKGRKKNFFHRCLCIKNKKMLCLSRNKSTQHFFC